MHRDLYRALMRLVAAWADRIEAGEIASEALANALSRDRPGTGDEIQVFSVVVYDSGEVLGRYFNNPDVQQTIEQSGLAAIFMSHRPNVNTTNLPGKIAANITHTSPVPTVLYNPQSVTVISPSVQPVIDESGPTLGDSRSVVSSSPGIAVSSNKAFVDAVMEGCK